MKKQAFMLELRKYLSPLKESTRLEIIADFEEHFQNGKLSGKSEEQVAKELGDPRALASEYLQTASSNDKAPSVTGASVGRGIVVGIGLFLLDIMIILPILFSLLAVVLALWTLPIVFIVASIALVCNPLFGFPYLLSFTTSISLLALAVATGIGMYYVSKYFIKLLIAFGKMHYRIIKGGSRG
jgi:uncharacterized membrane protein